MSALMRRWRKFRVRRPYGHLSLIAGMKRHELVSGLVNPDLDRRAGGRYALLMTLPRGGAVAEIGVWRGGFSALLLEALQPRRLLLADPWSSGCDELPFGAGKTAADPQAAFDAAHDEVRQRFGCMPGVEVIRSPSVEAAAGVADRSLDVAYIDGAHTYEAVAADLRAWFPKLKPGGTLCGDDYTWNRDGWRTFPVRQAVDEFIRETRPKRWAVWRKQWIIELR